MVLVENQTSDFLSNDKVEATSSQRALRTSWMISRVFICIRNFMTFRKCLGSQWMMVLYFMSPPSIFFLGRGAKKTFCRIWRHIKNLSYVLQKLGFRRSEFKWKRIIESTERWVLPYERSNSLKITSVRIWTTENFSVFHLNCFTW